MLFRSVDRNDSKIRNFDDNEDDDNLDNKSKNSSRDELLGKSAFALVDISKPWKKKSYPQES